MKKIALLSVLAVLCIGFIGARSEGVELRPGVYTVGADIVPGWYRLSYVDDEFASVYVYTGSALEKDSVLCADYGWYAEDCIQNPHEAVPLISGCRVVVGDMNDGMPDENAGAVSFELLREFDMRYPMPDSAAAFTVGAGEYVCGTDFPAGDYSVKAAGAGNLSFVNYDIYDENGKRVFNGVLQSEEYAARMTEEYGESISANSLGKVSFKNGWRYVAEVGDSRFEPYTGITFD